MPKLRGKKRKTFPLGGLPKQELEKQKWGKLTIAVLPKHWELKTRNLVFMLLFRRRHRIRWDYGKFLEEGAKKKKRER